MNLQREDKYWYEASSCSKCTLKNRKPSLGDWCLLVYILAMIRILHYMTLPQNTYKWYVNKRCAVNNSVSMNIRTWFSDICSTSKVFFLTWELDLSESLSLFLRGIPLIMRDTKRWSRSPVKQRMFYQFFTLRTQSGEERIGLHFDDIFYIFVATFWKAHRVWLVFSIRC